MGSAQVQGDLWSVRAQEWSDLQEASFRPVYEAALDAVKAGPGSSLFDVGCGAGLALEVARSRGVKVSGLDAAPGLAKIARARCPDGDIRIGEIEELPFADRSFDVTTGFNSFQYATDPAHAVAEARRVTKPGGAVVIMVWALPTNASSRLISPPSENACRRPRRVRPVRSRCRRPARSKRWQAKRD